MELQHNQHMIRFGTVAERMGLLGSQPDTVPHPLRGQHNTVARTLTRVRNKTDLQQETNVCTSPSYPDRTKLPMYCSLKH